MHYRTIATGEIVTAEVFDPHQQPWPTGVQPWPDAQGIQPRDGSWGYVETPVGWAHMYAGNLIITDSKGDVWVCTPGEFEARYEMTQPLKAAGHPTGDKLAQIERDFTYHAPHGDQVQRYQQIRDKAKEFALLIVELTPYSREQSLALTNLEQASMWANAAIARNE